MADEATNNTGAPSQDAPKYDALFRANLSKKLGELTDSDHETAKNSWSGKKTKGKTTQVINDANKELTVGAAISRVGHALDIKSSSVAKTMSMIATTLKAHDLWEQRKAAAEKAGESFDEPEPETTVPFSDQQVRQVKYALDELGELYHSVQDAYELLYDTVGNIDFGDGAEASKPKTRGTKTDAQLAAMNAKMDAYMAQQAKLMEMMAAKMGAPAAESKQ